MFSLSNKRGIICSRTRGRLDYLTIWASCAFLPAFYESLVTTDLIISLIAMALFGFSSPP